MTEQEQQLIQEFIEILQLSLGEEVYTSMYNSINNYLGLIRAYHINYSEVKNNEIKKQLENDNKLMVSARIKNDFGEYCRCASLQIEPILNHFNNIYEREFKDFNNSRKPKDPDYSRMGKYGKLAHWWSFMKRTNRKDYWALYNTLKIREATSHRVELGIIDIQTNLQLMNQNSSSCQRILYFYNQCDFILVKNLTEDLVKGSLLHFKLI